MLRSSCNRAKAPLLSFSRSGRSCTQLPSSSFSSSSLRNVKTIVQQVRVPQRCNLQAHHQKQRQPFSSSTASSSSSSNSTSTSTIRKDIQYSILGSLLISTAYITKYIYDNVGGTSEGLRRTASFYSLAIPKYIQYRYHMAVQSDDDIWDQLDIDTSRQGLEKILELGGFYIKSGQMCAANIGNAFPKVWQETMSVLQDQCPHKPFPIIRQIIQEEYNNTPMEDIFESFDPTPIGSASIGQVHRATLRSKYCHGKNRNRNVVVKVQYPEVERVFRGDVRTIKMFAQVAQPVHVPPLEEIEKQFMTEFDYQQEAKQMNRVRENLLKSSNGSSSSDITFNKDIHVAVPEAYTDLCTPRVLVMEELQGEKMADALKKDMERHARRMGMTLDEFEKEEGRKLRELKQKQQQKVTDGNASGDVNANATTATNGPTAKEYETYIRLLDSKRKVSNAAALLHNWTLGLVSGSKRQYEGRNTLPLNHAKIIDDLIYIHGHEVLVDGYFNGDPHPGNVILSDKNGKAQLGLIDYGQVKELSTSERHLFCKIVIALTNDDRPEIIKLMKEAGFKSKYMDEEVIYKYAKVSYDEDNDELTDGKHIQMFMEDLQARDPIQELPKNFIMVGRTSVMLRGLAHALRQSRSVAEAWKPIAEEVLEKEQVDTDIHNQ